MELLVMVLSETTIPAEFLPPKVPSGVRSGTFAGHPAMPRKDDASACSAKPLGPEPLVSKGLQLQLHFWDRNLKNVPMLTSLRMSPFCVFLWSRCRPTGGRSGLQLQRLGFPALSENL